MNNKIKIFAVLLLALALGGCNKKEQFVVEGSVAGAADKMLYLEQLGLDETLVLDSLKLNDKGTFSFSHEVPEVPDYYRLRLGAQTIPFAISSPTNLKINADAENFQISYTIEGDPDAKKFREVWLAQLDTDKELKELINQYNNGGMTIYDFAIDRDSILGNYKEIATKYIYNDPGSTVAYFALFQQVDGNLIFNLYDKKDSKAFTAVANVNMHQYPESPRSKHLEQLAIRSMAVLRAQAQQLKEQKEIEESLKDNEVSKVNYIDFTLPNLAGEEVALSSVVSGAPTLLCFSTMDANWTPAVLHQLNQIHQKYSPKGLKIVQVSLDRDPHLWRTASEKLPWICLQEKNADYSQLVGYYNISSLPTLFFFEKGGEMMYRITSAEPLIKLLERL